ncbi:MAG: hypothetical protein J3K34DRAFT_431712 [Monoraphidium minutum]|nr:MAG: hypothetical protein J3K34DRAFT_431712 [Monoraphidium minutum]
MCRTLTRAAARIPSRGPSGRATPLHPDPRADGHTRAQSSTLARIPPCPASTTAHLRPPPRAPRNHPPRVPNITPAGEAPAARAHARRGAPRVARPRAALSLGAPPRFCFTNPLAPAAPAPPSPPRPAPRTRGPSRLSWPAAAPRIDTFRHKRSEKRPSLTQPQGSRRACTPRGRAYPAALRAAQGYMNAAAHPRRRPLAILAPPLPPRPTLGPAARARGRGRRGAHGARRGMRAGAPSPPCLHSPSVPTARRRGRGSFEHRGSAPLSASAPTPVHSRPRQRRAPPPPDPPF